MSLRPRYSLLTLLVLTAGIAVGIKLWRGPHWVVLDNPPSVSEYPLLEQISSPNFQQLFPFEMRVQYLNTLSGREVLLIHGEPAPPEKLMVVSWATLQKGNGSSEHVESKDYAIFPLSIMPGDTLPPALQREVLSVTREEILRWYSSKPKPPVTPTTTEPSESQSSLPKPPPAIIPSTYFLSNHKQVYEYHSTYFVIAVSRILVSEIPDPALRTVIEQELANLPDPK